MGEIQENALMQRIKIVSWQYSISLHLHPWLSEEESLMIPKFPIIDLRVAQPVVALAGQREKLTFPGTIIYKNSRSYIIFLITFLLPGRFLSYFFYLDPSAPQLNSDVLH